ncbi:TonB family protein [Acanthopleuribacter pedis]
MREPDSSHSIHFDIAFARQKQQDTLPKKALLATLILTLVLIHTPMAQSRHEVVHEADAPAPNNRTILKVEHKIVYNQPTIQRRRNKRPMPDPTPREPELVQVADQELPDVDVAIFNDFTFSEDDFPDAPPVSSVLEQDALGLAPPVITKRVPPQYPKPALRVGLQGYVIVEAIMRADGTLTNVRVLRGLGKGRFGFEDAARKALEQWEFLPGELNGGKVDVRMTLKIDFSLSR